MEIEIVLFCGDRVGARRVLNEMLHRGVEVVGCVFEEPKPNLLSAICEENRIPCFKDQEMYAALKGRSIPEIRLGDLLSPS